MPPGGSSNWWKQIVLDHAVASAGDRGKVHVVAEKLALLAPWLDAQAPAPGVVVPAPAALPPAVEEQLQPGAVVVHAPSMWTYKQWPVTHFRQVIEGLLAQGRQVVLTGGPGDRECIAPLLALAPPPRLLDAAGQLDFNQLAGLLGRAALYIGPDTSVSHLAAAAGLPVIAIFGPTNPLRWSPCPAPGKDNVTVLQAQGLSCVPAAWRAARTTRQPQRLPAGHHAGEGAGRSRAPARLEQHDVVLLLAHGAFALQRDRLADEVRQAGQVLALFVQEQLDHRGATRRRGIRAG